MSTGINKIQSFHLLRRLSNRSRLPRLLWWPNQEEITQCEDTTKRHEECSRTINRMFLAIVAFSLFCVVTLGGSDEGLLGVGAEIELPFAGVRMAVTSFVIVGPMILLALTAYMHLFVGEWAKLRSSVPLPKRAANFFNFETISARLLTSLAFYWLTPLILCFFCWKALPLPFALRVQTISGVAIAFMIWLSIRRARGRSRLYLNMLKWILLIIVAGIYAQASLSGNPWSRPLLLQGIDFKGKNLTGFNLQGADLLRANLDKTQLNSLNLSNANLKMSTLNSSDLSDSVLFGAILESVYGRETSFVRANMTKVQGAKADLVNGNFAEAILSEATFHAARLSKSNLQSATLDRTDLSGAEMSGVNMKKARLTRVSLFGTNLAEANFDHAIFEDVDLRGAVGITQQQLQAICVLGGVKLPTGVVLDQKNEDFCPPTMPAGFSVR